jgi:hypothetical protein
MAATPRSALPALVAPQPLHNLQISPNLEALLQHDELTRRNSSSPTSAYNASPSSGFPISLPPPPPRKAKGSRMAGQREQEPFPTTRSKEQRRKSAVVGSDFWLPGTPDRCAAGQSTVDPSSRPMTPNPYLNPTPILGPINTPPHPDFGTSARPAVILLVDTHTPPCQMKLRRRNRLTGLSRMSLNLSRPDLQLRSEGALVRQTIVRRTHSTRSKKSCGWVATLSTSSRAPAMTRIVATTVPNRVTWMRCKVVTRSCGYHTIPRADAATPDRQMRHVPAALTQDTATVTVCTCVLVMRRLNFLIPSRQSKSATSYLRALQQGPHLEQSETASIRSYSTRFESGPISDPTPIPPLPPAHLLPRLSLPSIPMSHNSSRLHSIDSVTGNDYLSFIDFFSTSSTPDESNLSNIQDNARDIRSSRRQLQSITIPPSGLYSISQHNPSSASLASMRFAPPSPTVQQASPTYLNSSSSVALSSMMFAPPSPSAERTSSLLQPFSDPPSPYSPLEFAPPPFPLQGAEEPSLPTAPGLASERGRKLKPKKRSKSSSPYCVLDPVSPLPPTTNQLDANERADRIWRNRKLTRVFGRTPGAEESTTDTDEPRVSKKSHPPSLAALLTKQKNHRHAVSVSLSLKAPGRKTEPSSPWQTDGFWSPGGRRHSTPLATGFTLYVDDEQDETAAKDPFRSPKFVDSPDAASTRSFIDLSDDEIRDDDVSDLSFFPPRPDRRRCLHHSTSTPSLVESLDSEAQAEIEKRRKREKLARLHRFLGSHVPPEAVTGSLFGPPSAPPAVPEESNHEHWVRRNKSPPPYEFDRGKEELDEREKALNVRRAQKMERVRTAVSLYAWHC